MAYRTIEQPVQPSFTAHEGKRVAVGRALTEADAIDIWIARWLRVKRKHLIARYQCDPRRLYEIWEGTRFASARKQAIERFSVLHPTLVDRIDFGTHRRIPRAVHPDQLALFDNLATEHAG